MKKDLAFMNEAVAQSLKGMLAGEGGPFGAVVVKDGQIVGRGNNRVTSSNDPTAHAEVEAIRDACRNLNTFQLDGCVLYTSCEPCPMCLGAIYWARPDKVYYANTREDAADIGFDDNMIYEELNVPMSGRRIPFAQIGREFAMDVFRQWTEKTNKIQY
ncbi:tRNA(Arg) A34 adenosine deaminase TadA [Flexibacter flexilis DSM 6793]|uniref:tRNA(Arg) A34 adenosine deaminase TadA n=1 Tax=Flexibacter flexilis DSM 6793 TaxID=927664 RepID=A0A1I1J4B1_9BACT|nr:nucleoside deaminase [Flexibacter flexilis]SFC43469.1 tRNA(Arg) A34 adenosine deaminase TadA [Flexibacter flexilis DSM 6793]